jgi:hypothetical protein
VNRARVVAAVDLDRTLIYSAAAFALPPGREPTPLRCVETLEGKPLSYLTEGAAAAYVALIRAARVVPSTTRTRAQFARVHLPGPTSQFAIAANGGHLLVRGRADEDWCRSVRARLAAETAPLEEIRAHLEGCRVPALQAVRAADELFCYLLVDRAALPARFVWDLDGFCAERGWRTSLQGRKLYCVPRPLSKSAALAEIARRVGAAGTVAAGDSFLDAELLEAADRAVRPAAGELAEQGWTRPHLAAATVPGVLGGEQVIGLLHEAVAELAESEDVAGRFG